MNRGRSFYYVLEHPCSVMSEVTVMHTIFAVFIVLMLSLGVAGAEDSASAYTDPVTGMEFVKVQDGLYMGKYEVTNAQFKKFRPAHNLKKYTHNGHSFDGDNQPVVYVSQSDAFLFGDWLSRKTGMKYRLPEENEWERACKEGGDTETYWDDDRDACLYANVCDKTCKRAFGFKSETFDCDDGFAVTSPVGRKKPNKFGLYDMLGNVWEWTNTWKVISRDVGVMEGGSWLDEPAGFGCSNSTMAPTSLKDNNIGFRLVLEK